MSSQRPKEALKKLKLNVENALKIADQLLSDNEDVLDQFSMLDKCLDECFLPHVDILTSAIITDSLK